MKSEDSAVKMKQPILASSPDTPPPARINNVMAASTVAFILEQYKNICRENKQSHAFGERVGPGKYGKQVIKLPAWRRQHTRSSPLSARTSLKCRREIKVAQTHMAKETWRGDDGAKLMSTKTES